jgi:S1-C subfamily serine protease
MARFLTHTLWSRPRAGSRFGHTTSLVSGRFFCAGVLVVLLLSGGGARADSALPAATLKAVKSATVLLNVTQPDSETVQGSGFFAVEPNLVLTNAHVLGMLRPEGRPPQRIDVVVRSGQPDEKTLPGQVLGVDRSTDLAVLRVTGKDLPEPLRVVSAKDLTETQTVYVFGFPFGKELGKEITVSSSSVSSLRRDGSNTLPKVQVNGGMNPGNSGGPVVDPEGRVVGVAVSGIRQTQINFAVPGDYVHVILNGRVTGLEVGYPYRDGDAVKAPVTARLLDPLDRVKQVSLQVWTGDPGQPRPASTTEPKPQPGDSPVTSVALDYAKGVAKGEVTLPPLPAGKVHWVRPVYVNGAGETRWVAGTVHQAKPPVDHVPVLLKYKQPADERTRVDLTSTATFRVRDFEGEMRNLSVNLGAELEEQGEHRTDTEDMLTLAVSYRRFNWQVKLDDQPLLPADRAQRISRQMTVQKAQVRVDPEGNIHLEARRGSPRSEVGELNELVIQSLQAIAVPLPGKTVTPGNPWKASRTLLVSSLGSPQPGLADVTYTYLGTRKVGDRSEALISLAGTIRSPKGKGLAMAGRMTGDADVDVTTGRVNSAQVLLDVDMDAGEGRRTAKVSGALEVRLRRTPL